jgi:hypothetical protein
MKRLELRGARTEAVLSTTRLTSQHRDPCVLLLYKG